MSTPDQPTPRHRAGDDRREVLVGAAATGDLSPEERTELDALVRADPVVGDEVASLQGLVGRIDRVGAWEVVPTSGSLDAGVRALTAGEGPGRVGRVRRAVVAVGLVAAGAVGVLGVQSTLDRPVEGPPGTLGAVEDVALTASGVEESADVDAHLVAHTWGTEAVLHAKGLQPGATYEVVLVDADGREVAAGAFLGSEVPVDCRLNAAVLREQVTGLRITTADGDVVRSAELPRLG